MGEVARNAGLQPVVQESESGDPTAGMAAARRPTEARAVAGDTWHSGERSVHRRLGIEAETERIARGIRNTIPEVAAAFLESQPFIIVGLAGERGVWAGILEGAPGFVRTETESRIRIESMPATPDPIHALLADGAAIGLLAIEPSTRRRMRLNGRLERSGDRLVVQVDQVYSNCPRFIHPRQLGPRTGTKRPAVAGSGRSLASRPRRWIETADTFFIATTHRDGGSDVSHRGGPAGFVRVIGESVIRFPDYAGNRMFNTLGNLVEDPRAGLLFADFATGRTLQITGRARIDWAPGDAVETERRIDIEIDSWLELDGALATGDLDGAPRSKT